MNAKRRKELTKLNELLEQAHTTITNVVEQLESLKDDERESFDALPEGLQQADRGQAMDEAANALEEAYDTLSDIQSDLDNVKDKVSEAIEL